ncbi:tubulin/FtsZ family protein [Chloroflexota bacterium]
MKLIVIGCGQCGGRVADEFARLNIKARVRRGIGIITGVYAVNTDVADLTGLSYIKANYRQRIVVGTQKTGGHGVGKINELGAEIAKEDSDKIIEAVRATERFPETDAFLLIAGAAGGTGSGAIAVLTQHLKERFPEKPLYNLIVLPFRHEEQTEERAIYNTATCLKSAYLVADAIFLVDNQRYIRKDSSIKANLTEINALVVEPFYNLLSAGEEKIPGYIGSKTLDAGDIIQTLAGWTIIGHGRIGLPRFRLLFGRKGHFKDKINETHRGIQSMQKAISELSLKCNPSDARRGLYLLSAPPSEMNMDLIQELGARLKSIASDAIIRRGDYTREKSTIDVTIILTELTNIPKINDYFTRAINYIYATKRRREGIDFQHKTVEDLFKEMPSLL